MPGTSAAPFTTTEYSRLNATTGHYVLFSDIARTRTYAAELQLFLDCQDCPLVVLEALDIIARPHGYVTVSYPGPGTFRVLPLSAIRMIHCAVVEHSLGTLSLLPADCLPSFLFDAGHVAQAAANDAAGTVPVPSAEI